MTGKTRISQLVATTRKRLVWSTLLKAYGPAGLLATAYATLAMFGVFGPLSSPLKAAVTLCFWIGLALLVWRGARTFRPPQDADSRTRVDGLAESHPATTMIDRPARPDPVAAALWQAHQTRTAQDAESLRPPALWGLMQEVDPAMLRVIAPATFIAAFCMTADTAPDRLGTAFTADIGALVGADKLVSQAWVAPPPYTGKAPFILEQGVAPHAPQGSQITIRVESPGAPRLRLLRDGKSTDRELTRGADGAFEAQLTVDAPLEAELRWWGLRANYAISTLSDMPPTARFVTAPASGPQDTTTFSWMASDDYGVARLELELTLTSPPPGGEGLTDTIALTLPGIEPQKAEAREKLDLTRHKWAGLEVSARLRTIDANEQAAYSAPAVFTLPDKLFLNPMARAAAEVRHVILREWRPYASADTLPHTEITWSDLVDSGTIEPLEPPRLELAPPEVRRAAIMLDALTYRPEEYFNDQALFLGLRQAHATLKTARAKPDADLTDDILWSVALRAEYGDFANATAALEAARKALERALRDGAGEDEVKRLMEAFRQAVDNYLQAQIAEALRRGGDMQAGSPSGGGKSVQDDDLEKMLKALEELAETGATAQARQLLSDMSELLERMKNFQFQPGGEGEGQPMSGPMAEALENLAEALREQRELTDDTSQSMRQGDTPEDLAQRQQDLMDKLQSDLDGAREGQQDNETGAPDNGESMDGSGPSAGPPLTAPNDSSAGGPGDTPGDNTPSDDTGGDDTGGDDSGGNEGDGGSLAEDQVNELVRRALDAQKQAADALRNGDLETAERWQKQAEQTLADAATEMARRADQATRESGRHQPGQQTDPLGRPTGNGPNGLSDEVVIPDKLERQRARDILDELRRRSSERDLTQDELDYLQRLLDRF